MSTIYAGRACVDPAALAQSCREHDPPVPTDPWFARANRYACPLGREPGTARFLLTGADIDEIDLTTDHTLEFRDSAGNSLALKRITLLRATCVTPGFEGDGRAAYECVGADRRHHLAKVPIDKGYNVWSLDGTGWLARTLDSGSEWTWPGVLQDLWTALGLGTAPALPFAPHLTPGNLTYYGGWAWAAVCDVLDRLACRVKYDPVADSFSFVRLGEANAAGDAAIVALAASRTWDAYPSESDRGRRPEKLRVRFRKKPMPSDGASPYYAVDVTLDAAAGVVAGTFAQADDDMPALVYSGGAPANAGDLSDRAAERAGDYLRKLRYFDDRYLQVYADFQPSAPAILGSTIASFALDDRGAAMRTEVVGRPDAAVEDWSPLARLPVPWPVAPRSRAEIDGTHTTTSITADATWTDSGLQIDLSEAGTYLIHAAIDVLLNANNASAWIAGRLYDATNGAYVDGSVFYAAAAQLANVNVTGSGNCLVLYTVAAAATIKLQGYRPAGPGYATSDMRRGLMVPGGIKYLKVA